MQYSTVQELIDSNGLRIILVAGVPSPWGQAAKAMMEYKGLEYTAAPLMAGETNDDIVAWGGVNSGPVVAWNDEAPINRWTDIMFLLERLAPKKPLVPEESVPRAKMIGLSHEICGELGLGWNRRLTMFQPMMESGEAPEGIARMSGKYGYNESDVALANQRQIATLGMLTSIFKEQQDQGSDYFIGDAVTALDFYWAAFCNIMHTLPVDQCPTAEAIRPLFDTIDPDVKAAIDPILLAHRDRMMQAHFKVPMEF